MVPGREAVVPLVLASASPRRTAILTQMGVPHEVAPSDIEETSRGAPEAVALENACRKARAVATRRPGARVLGADTVVAHGSAILAKPADSDQARAHLTRLAGSSHRVLGGICIIEANGKQRSGLYTTIVAFRTLDADAIEHYIASGEWHDRAGGYAIQGLGAKLVQAIAGDFFNVVGLSISGLLDLAPDLASKDRGSGVTLGFDTP